MVGGIQFNLPKYIIPLFIILILKIVHIILSDYNKFLKSKKKSNNSSFIDVYWRIISLFFYLFQNKFYLNHIEENINNNDDSFSSYKVRKFF